MLSKKNITLNLFIQYYIFLACGVGFKNSPNVSSACRKRRLKEELACGVGFKNSPNVSSACRKSRLKEASSPRQRDGGHRAGNPCPPVLPFLVNREKIKSR